MNLNWGYIDPLPCSVGPIGPTLFEGKILQNLFSKKIRKIHVFHGKSFFLNLLLQVNPQKMKFLAVLHVFGGPTPKMLGQLLLCHIVS